MKKFRCLIVDDEPVARRILEGYLEKLPEYECVAKCANAISAGKVLQRKQIDLLLLDLEMPKIKGFRFLRDLENAPAVIITTAHRQHAWEGFELDVIDYLLKPISFPRFLKALNRFKKVQQNKMAQYNDSAYLYVICDRKMQRLRKKEISYIRGMNNYVRIYYQNRSFTVYSSLQQILKKLGAPFVRIHKSYIVNGSKISAFTSSVIEVNGTKLPVGQVYQKNIDSLIFP